MCTVWPGLYDDLYLGEVFDAKIAVGATVVAVRVGASDPFPDMAQGQRLHSGLRLVAR